MRYSSTWYLARDKLSRTDWDLNAASIAFYAAWDPARWEEWPWRAAYATIERIMRWHYFTAEPFDASAYQAESNEYANLLRDILGTLFRPFVVDPRWLAWNSGTIAVLAQTIYDERRLPEGALDKDRLAVLADALEEAGCTDPDILAHCRGPGPHVRGCWVIDLLLGKE
jgi:hypothetical protein